MKNVEPLYGFYLIDDHHHFIIAQPVIACSKLTIETLEQGVKYVQS